MPNSNIPNVPWSNEESFVSVRAGEAVNVGKGERFTISVQGFGTATIGLERKLPGQTAFNPVESYTANTEKDGIAAEAQELRLNATVWSSGTILGRIGK